MCSYGLPKVQICGLVAIYENALKESQGKLTSFVDDYRKSKNPYLSRYGGTRIEKLKNYSFISKLFCISDLIWFMVKEGEKIMKGSVHEDFCIVHAALVIMTANTTITCMRKNNYLNQWFLPFNWLYYARRLVGNVPEFMPLYYSLNRDILHSFHFHCVLIRFFLKDEESDRGLKKRDLVMPPQRRLLVDSSLYGNRKRDHILQQKLLNMLIEPWKRRKLYTVRMARQLKDCQIKMDTDN